MKNKMRLKRTTYEEISQIVNSFDRILFYLSSLGVIFLIGFMSTVWYNLPKSQNDPETIEEAINRIIAEHNAEPTAHSAPGEAIDIHRANGIIDHPEGSVLGDKFSNSDFIVAPLFENTSVYSKSATGLTFGLGGVRMDTSTTINTLRYLLASGQYSHAYVKENRLMTFQCSASISNDTNVIAYFGLGGFGLFGEPPGFGFKIHNGSLYAVTSYWDGVGFQETLEQILGVTVTTRHYYRIQVIPDEGIANYYIDQTLVATMSIPNNEDYGLAIFEMNVKNLAAAQKILSVSNIYVSISVL